MALYIHNIEKRLIAKTVAFLYRWTHFPTGKWYIGSRTAAGCHPADGYICSSKTVNPLIVENQNKWIREVLCIGNPDYIIKLETQYLVLLDAKKDPLSYNKHNGDGKFTSTGKAVSYATRNTMSQNRKGQAKLASHKLAIKNALLVGFNNGSIVREPRVGNKAPGFKKYYVSPVGQLLTARDASMEFKVTPETIRNWGNLNKNGWTFKMALES